MSWREALNAVDMERVALVAPRESLRDLLVEVADDGGVELESASSEGSGAPSQDSAASRLQRLASRGPVSAELSRAVPDLDACERAGRLGVIAGEAELETHADSAVHHGRASAVVGWMPARHVRPLADRLSGVGASVVPLPRPRGADPPTLLPGSGPGHEVTPLVSTYATVPYADVNPAALAAVAYVVMFGMMFADAGQGALLLLVAVAARRGWWARLDPLRRVWLFLAGAGATSMVFGALYGEFFGPTGVLPVLWLSPLEEPITLLAAAVGVGAVLLAGAYALGTVNRYREGGWRLAVYAPSGLAGSALYAGLAAIAVGLWQGVSGLVLVGGAVALAGLVTAFIGLHATSGGGASGLTEATIELVDLVIRLGSNLVSFARLAAFGLTHAALGAIVWQATTSLWTSGPVGGLAAVLVFIAGNAVTFVLEGLVAAIQALRLEYYELFSRVFDREGRPFRPWHVPLTTEVSP